MGPGPDAGIDYHDEDFESVASTPSGFASKSSSREDKGRREPEEREGSQATVRETLDGNSDPSTMTFRKDSVPPASAAINAPKTRSLRSKSFKKVGSLAPPPPTHTNVCYKAMRVRPPCRGRVG